jgi:hypothetical protein
MTTKQQFKSFKPRKKLTREEYEKQHRIPHDISNNTENHHYYRELCANCNSPYGKHYGAGENAFCNTTN